MGRWRITWKKSSIGYSQRQREVIRSLGLRRLHHTVEHADNPTVRGMINKVRHLVEAELLPEEAGGGSGPGEGPVRS